MSYLKAVDRDRDGFLAELSALTIKYGIGIGGCGCCGSPFLSATDDDEQRFKAGHYTVKDKDDSSLSWVRAE